MTRLITRLLLITILSALAASCSSSRKNTPATGSYTPGETSSPPASQQLAWADLSLPVTVSVTRPASLRVSGTMTMVNGKDIHISMRMLGFEVGAAYITSDSLYAYAKLQRVYVAESISRLLGGLDADISDLQSLLIGAPLTLPSPGAGTSVDIITSDTTGQPLDISLTTPSGRKAHITYTPQHNTQLASQVDISATTSGRQLAASLSYDWGRAKADTGASKTFSIPSGYRRIDAAALLKSLKL